MATSIVPDLLDALVAALESSIVGSYVLDGDSVVTNDGDFIMVGIGDIDNEGRSTSATSRQEWANANYTAKDETGQIACVAATVSGNSTVRDARLKAYELLSSVENTLRANPSLGVDGVLWTGVGDHDFDQWLHDRGAAALIAFQIDYRARI